MKNVYVSDFCKKNRGQWDNCIIDYPTALGDITHTKLQGSFVYNTNGNLQSIKTYNITTKSRPNLKYVGQYHEIEIDKLPIRTEYYIKPKIYGETYYLSKYGCSGRYYFAREFGSQNNIKLTNKLKKDLRLKYLMDSYKESTIEIIYNDIDNNIYLNNICTKNEIFKWNILSDIALKFEIKTPKLLNQNILEFDSTLLDCFYNTYDFDDADYMIKKDYLLMFIFKNKKYLFSKI